ncbi:myoD family inhibitor domain-containing protein 2 [Nerophis ophidion]|uniref:myoD family inhibitor domain-containing protein 2 n=1 Tax=Nerophis ophidion TaxID=159077 RepID=UPI002ADF6098|nr:myoD family inhibitor domain-containing protein 2 [Nerophis ophidion]
MDAEPNPGSFEKLDNGRKDLTEETTVSETSVEPKSFISSDTEARELKVQNGKGGAVQAVSINGSSSVEQSQFDASDEKSHERITTNTFNMKPPDDDDICASILLACLFCNPLDCLVATVSGCNQCFWSLCSPLFCCQSATLQPLLDASQHCDVCTCQEQCCSCCECSVGNLCLQATECLDLAMEISQMLYH